MSEVAGGSTWMSNVWIMGHVPDKKRVTLSRNGASFLRVVSTGKLALMCMPLHELIAAVRAADMSKDNFSDNSLASFVEELDGPKLQVVMDKGCPVYYMEQVDNELIFLPTGWLMVEWGLGGNVAVITVRKSYMQRGAAAKANYEVVRKITVASKKAVSRIDWILEHM